MIQPDQQTYEYVLVSKHSKISLFRETGYRTKRLALHVGKRVQKVYPECKLKVRKEK